MDQLEKNSIYLALFDLYGSLLTEKQTVYFKAYYEQDYSLAEVAHFLNVSRNAVHDQLKSAIERLTGLENHLGLLKNQQAKRELWAKYESTKDENILKLIQEMDENNGTR